MKVLQSGTAKSGNDFLWKIINNLLRESGQNTPSFVSGTAQAKELSGREDLTHEDQLLTDVVDFDHGNLYWRISSIYRERIDNFKVYLGSERHVWTHSYISKKCEKNVDEFDKIIYLITYQSDLGISQANFSFSKYIMTYRPHKEKDVDQFLKRRLYWQCINWQRSLNSWLPIIEKEKSLIVFYEDLVDDSEKGIRNIAKHLGLKLSDAQIDKVVEKTSFNTMKVNNPGHVRQGRKYKWQEILAPEVNKRIVDRIGGTLSALGYPLDSNSCTAPNGANELIAARKVLTSEARMRLQEVFVAGISVFSGGRTIGNQLHVIKRELTRLLAR
jgi:hypothetical protein